MKKIILNTVLMLLVTSTFAQIPAKTKYIGGMLGFTSTNNESKFNGSVIGDSKSFEWNFGPEVGYFIKDNISLGISIGLNGSKDIDDKPSGTNEKSIEDKFMLSGATLYSRKFFNVNENFHLFGGLDLGFYSGKMKYYTVFSNNTPTTVDNIDLSVMGININAGMLFSLSEKWSLVGKWAPGLGYSISKSKMNNAGSTSTTESTTKSFGLNVNTLGTPFNVGLYFSF